MGADRRAKNVSVAGHAALMLASTPQPQADHYRRDRPTVPERSRRRREPDQGVAVGINSEYEIRCQADCCGLRKYGGLRYFNRVSYV